MSKISQYGSLSSPTSSDLLVIVDVTDTSMAGSGTTKAITVANFLAGVLAGSGGVPSAAIAPQVVALTDGASISVNAALGNDFSVTIAGNRTMAAPSNPVNGECITFVVAQDSTGSRTLTWTSGAGGYSFGAGSAPTLSTAAHAVDLVAFRYAASAGGGAGAWCSLGSALGY